MNVTDEATRINAYVPSGSQIAGVPSPDPAAPEPRPLNAAREPDPWARWMNLALGAWLVVSAFFWQQSQASVINTVLVGIAIGAVAVASMVREPIRVLQVILAPWLFVSTFAFTTASSARWNNAVVAFAVLLFALVPGSRHTNAGRPHRIARSLT